MGRTIRERIILHEENACFACVNSGEGFISFFEDALKDSAYIYVIKGGPGTGKSGLMSRVADEASARGEEVERILCSSDPHSLDGVVLKDRGIALVDGTAPHTYGPGIPGVSGEFIDLGACWDKAKLKSREEEIRELNGKKSLAYRAVFSLLGAAKKTSEVPESLLEAHFMTSAGKTALEKALKPVKNGRNPVRTSFIRKPAASFGMEGEAVLDCWIEKAGRIETVLPFHGAERFFLDALTRRIADENAGRVLVSPDPVSLKPESVFFADSGLLIRCGSSLCRTNETTVSLRKLFSLPEEEKMQLKSYAREETGLKKLAAQEMQRVKEAHFALEEIYKEAMDFEKVNEIRRRLIKEIFT